MSRKRLLILFFLSSAAAYFLFPGKSTDEAQIRSLIRQTAAAVTGKDLGDFIVHISKDFSGPNNINRDELKRYMAGFFFRNRQINITIRETAVSVNKDRQTATAEVIATVTAGSREEQPSTPYGLDKETNRFEIRLIKSEQKWRIIRARRSELQFKSGRVFPTRFMFAGLSHADCRRPHIPPLKSSFTH